jgi:hypothetical protein
MSAAVAAPPAVPPVSRGAAELASRCALPLATLVFFLATAKGYGIFRDELYYLACARHLDWGYVDHPPMIALLAALARGLFGDSLTGLRALPALAAAATVLLVGDTARALGGGRWARLLAQLLAATAPVYLAVFTILSMNAFEVLIWAGLARLSVPLLSGGDSRFWLAFGALAGAGLETKVSVGLLGAGLAVGLLAARRVDVLRSKWLWLGGALAVALFLPYVLWEASHGWPTREFVAHAQAGKITRLSPLAYALAQAGMVGPVAALAAAAGLVWLLAARAARSFRALGWSALVVLTVYAFSIAKPYYFTPAYTLLFPAAGVALELWTAGRFARSLRTLVLLASASVLFAAPLAKPLLSEDRYRAWSAWLGVELEAGENHARGRLPQLFADMHGWRELAETVAAVHRTLPASEQPTTCVYGQNYGEAGAIDFFGPALGIPRAVSGHNNYWFWGWDGCSGDPILIVGGRREDHLRAYSSVEPAAVFRCDECMPYENGLTIWIARGLLRPPGEIWRSTRHFG